MRYNSLSVLFGRICIYKVRQTNPVGGISSESRARRDGVRSRSNASRKAQDQAVILRLSSTAIHATYAETVAQTCANGGSTSVVAGYKFASGTHLLNQFTKFPSATRTDRYTGNQRHRSIAMNARMSLVVVVSAVLLAAAGQSSAFTFTTGAAVGTAVVVPG